MTRDKEREETMSATQKLAAKILELQDRKAEIEEQIKDLRTELDALIDEGTTVDGDFKFTKYVNTRFDDATAKKNLSPEEYALITVPKADSKLATQKLSGDRLEKCKKTFGTIVKVGLVEA